MRSRTLLVVAALLAFAAVVWIQTRGDERESGDAPSPANTVEPTPAPTPERDGLAGVEPADDGSREAVELTSITEERAAEPAATVLPRLPVDRPKADLVLDVVDQNGLAVDAARLRVFSAPGTTHDLLAFDDGRGGLRHGTSDFDGRVTFEDLALGLWWVVIEQSGYVARQRVHHTSDAPQEVSITLDGPPSRLSVRVIDHDEAPVANALVTMRGGTVAGAILSGDRTHQPSATLEQHTDAGGVALFGDVGFNGVIIVANAPDGRMGSHTLWTDGQVRRAYGTGVDVIVGEPGVLFGAVRGTDGQQVDLRGARVIASLLTNSHPHYTSHVGATFETPVENAGYRFEALPFGRYNLAVRGAGDLRLALPPMKWGDHPMDNSIDPLEVDVTFGQETEQDLEVQIGGAIEGVVRTHEGDEPIEGVEIRAMIAPRTANFPDGFWLHGANVWRFDADTGGFDDHPESHPRTRTDANGRYRLGGLAVGSFAVEVAAGGRRYDVLPEVEVQAGETTELEHVLELAGAIAGVYKSGSYMGVTRLGEDRPRMVAIVPGDGLFAFSGLEPGKWVVSALHSNSGVAAVPLVTVDVEAGKTTWVDVDRDAELPVRLTGRVVDALGPIGGAWVRRTSDWIATDVNGRFEFGAVFSLPRRITFYVLLDDVQTHFQLDGEEAGAMVWEGDLLLGDESLKIELLDAQGAPTSGHFSLSGGPTNRPEIEYVSIDTRIATGDRTFDRLPAGAYTVAASFADGATLTEQITLPRDEPVVLRALASGEVEVLVRDADGKPGNGRHVYAYTWLGEGPVPEDDAARVEGSVLATGRTDHEGKVVLRGVAAGTVHVSIFRAWGVFSGSPASTPPPQVIELGAEGRAALVFDEPASE